MRLYAKRFWVLAAGLSGLAGYVDAIAFLRLGGYFVSFMSGNSTRMAASLWVDTSAATLAGGLIAAFVLGVILGTLTATALSKHRKPAVLLLVTVLLTGAAILDRHHGMLWPSLVLAMAMGAENAVFARHGEVSIGLTYMTGTLVKFGQAVAMALSGGPRDRWLPYLILWLSLTAGAVLGALAVRRLPFEAIAIAAIASGALTLYAAFLNGRVRGKH